MIAEKTISQHDNKWQQEANAAAAIINDINFKATLIDESNAAYIKHFVRSTLSLFYMYEDCIVNKAKALQAIDDDIIIVDNEQTDVVKWLEKCAKRAMSRIEGPTHQVFSIIAGRLLLVQMYFEYCRIHDANQPYEDMLKHITFCVDRKLYRNELVEYVTKFTLNVSVCRDLLFDYTSLKHFKRSYINTIDNLCCELPQHVFACVAAIFASRQNNILKSYYDFYNIISLKKLSLASPMLANLRTQRHENLASCFIIKVDDDIQSMFYNLYCIAKISKNGGGIGVSVSRIRSEGADVGDRSNAACGVVHFAKVINDTGLTVNQGGKRSAAITVALDIWHRDILTFLEMQTESGDIRKKAFDIFPQVVVNDTFMKFVEQKKVWTLFDPDEVRKAFNIQLDMLNEEEFENAYNFLLTEVQKNNAKLRTIDISSVELIKKIMRAQIETGLPYIFFKDTANRFNANKHDGQIACGNLCQESFSNVKHAEIQNEGNTIVTNGGYSHTCNLISLNLANILDETDLENAVRQSVRILDTSIDIGDPSVEESRNHNNRYRTIGIGALGLNDHLAYMNIRYADSQEYVSKMFERVLFFALSESNVIAIEKKAYEAFAGSEWSKGVILQKKYTELSTDLKWKELIDSIRLHGLRNGHLLAMAPNTSSSVVQNASASVLPIHKTFFFDNNSRGITPIFAIYYNIRKEFYEEYANISISKVVDVVSSIQQWVDQGISFELLFDLNHNTKASDIFDTIMKIWKMNCKTIYYVRTLQKRAQREVSCDACTL